MSDDRLKDALGAMSRGTAQTLLESGAAAAKLMRENHQRLADVSLSAMLVAARQMHNRSPSETAAYLNTRLSEAGFSIRVSIDE